MNMISKLYHGKIRPFEKSVVKRSEYRKHAESLCRYSEELLITLTDEQVMLFEQMCSEQELLNGINDEEAFACGFRIGIRLAAEGMLSESVNFTEPD